jgi:hypothetical protein
MKPLKYYFLKLFYKKESNNSIIRTKSIQDSFTYLEKRIQQKERLFFVRFGDGEFITMLKKNHRNYVYNEELDKEVENSFNIKDSNYLISCPINYPYDEFHAKGIYKQFTWQQEMIEVIKQKKLNTDFIFENPCIFHCMGIFKPKRLNEFLNKHIRNKKKLFVGSTDQKIAESLYGKIDHFVKIPTKNAYETIDQWWPEIEKNIDKVDLIIPSAGSSSNAIALRLWNMNCNVKLIDMGSIIDAADQKISRTWIRLQGHKILGILNPKPKISSKQRIKYLLKDIKFFFRNQVI